jgi:methyl-accepting chemotaxis protein
VLAFRTVTYCTENEETPINGAVSQMDQGTQQNAALVEQATAAAQSLQQQAHQLAEVVGGFKLDHAPATQALALR